jgi:hypothetical protein
VTGDIIVALVVVTALGFDFTNGFHDTANAMATTIATGAAAEGRGRHRGGAQLRGGVHLARGGGDGRGRDRRRRRDHAGADRQRQHQGRRRLRRADVGDRRVRHRDRARHLQRRLADHQDAADEGRRGPSPAGLRVRGGRRHGDPRLLARRLPAFDHAGRLRRGHRIGRRAPRRGGQLVGGRAHRRRLAAELACRGRDGGGRLRDRRPVRQRAVGPIVVGVALAIGCVLLRRANRATNIEPEETVSENPTFGPAPTPTRVPAAVS